jgi:hypothetical protein
MYEYRPSEDREMNTAVEKYDCASRAPTQTSLTDQSGGWAAGRPWLFIKLPVSNTVPSITHFFCISSSSLSSLSEIFSKASVILPSSLMTTAMLFGRSNFGRGAGSSLGSV